MTGHRKIKVTVRNENMNQQQYYTNNSLKLTSAVI
jgi:hypothetical protein